MKPFWDNESSLALEAYLLYSGAQDTLDTIMTNIEKSILRKDTRGLNAAEIAVCLTFGQLEIAQDFPKPEFSRDFLGGTVFGFPPEMKIHSIQVLFSALTKSFNW